LDVLRVDIVHHMLVLRHFNHGIVVRIIGSSAVLTGVVVADDHSVLVFVEFLVSHEKLFLVGLLF